mmetsp:Transcript_40122/g.72289  ORF Transcript_40122/g.72289 Transcript_40122/m.72289 type:complete len:164 (-) Transcript_40122:406-897(-)
MMNHWQSVLSFDESDISLESVIAFNSFPGPSESKGGHSFDRSRLIVVSISHCNVHHMRPETRQHVIVSPPPFRLIVECQVSKVLASRLLRENIIYFQQLHWPPVLLVVELDPAFLLVVGYNSFPIPPENEGECLSAYLIVEDNKFNVRMISERYQEAKQMNNR